jgi:hypothetical protein
MLLLQESTDQLKNNYYSAADLVKHFSDYRILAASGGGFNAKIVRQKSWMLEASVCGPES